MNSIECGRFIAQLRKEKQITQMELAEMLKVSNSAISRWETGEGYPDISIFPKLAEVLNVTVDELLKGEKIPQEEKRTTKISNRKFNNAFIGSIVILIAAFLIFVAITYASYRVWYGVIGFVVFSTASILWFMFSRNEVLDLYEDQKDAKNQLYHRTLLYYVLLVTFFVMMIPQMIATLQSNIVTSVLRLDIYLIWVVVIGLLGLVAYLIIQSLHRDETDHEGISIFRTITTQDYIVIYTSLGYVVFALVFNLFALIFPLGIPFSIFIAISLYHLIAKHDSRHVTILRIISVITAILTLILTVVGQLFSGSSNQLLIILDEYIFPIVIILSVVVLSILSIIGLIKKSKNHEYDDYFRFYRQFLMLIISFFTIAFIGLHSLYIINIFVSLLVSLGAFLIYEHHLGKLGS